jgi:hypothetical protein
MPRPDLVQFTQKPHVLLSGFDAKVQLPAGSAPRVVALRALDSGGFLGFRAARCSD